MVLLTIYHDSKIYTLQLNNDSTISELKDRLFEISRIPNSRQWLSGLSPAVNDQTHLRYAELNMLDYKLVLREKPFPVIPETIQVELREEEDEEEGDDNESQYDDARETLLSSGDEDEIITDDMFVNDVDGMTVDTREPLIPPDCEGSVEALHYFSERFGSRYGDIHPLFFIGSLSDAVKEATGVPADERKPMFLYLHHDQSILSNIFCSQLLCSESIVNYLSLNYLVWAWDLTRENLKRKLLDMVKDCFGMAVAANVDDIQPDHLPVILIVFKSKGQVDVRNIIQGHTDPDSLLTSLIVANEQHQMDAQDDMKEERERREREEMIRAQERAFEETLQADKEKERQKQLEQDMLLQKQLEEQFEKDKKEEERQRMENSIPPEPDKSCNEKISTLRIRFPDGTTDQRRFLANHTVRMLINYIGSKGYHPSEYKILTSYPKRNITQIDLDKTLLEEHLFPNETLHIEEDN